MPSRSEYEEDCGVTFGKVPTTALAKLTRVIDGEERPIGGEAAEAIRTALVRQGMLDNEGRLQPAFDPKRPGFTLDLPEAHRDLAPAIVDMLAAYQIERHIRKRSGRNSQPVTEGYPTQPRVFVSVGAHQTENDIPSRVQH